MGRVWLAGVCAVAGVLVLAGPGWALLALAAVVYLTPVPARLRTAARALGSRSTRLAGRWWRWLVSGRHEVAITLAVVALVLAPVGAGVAFGSGAAILVAAGMVAGGALLLGWDSRPAP